MPMLSLADRQQPRAAATFVTLDPANDHDSPKIVYPTTVRYVIESAPLSAYRPQGTSIFSKINQAAFDLAIDPDRADRYADIVGRIGLFAGFVGASMVLAKSLPRLIAFVLGA